MAERERFISRMTVEEVLKRLNQVENVEDIDFDELDDILHSIKSFDGGLHSSCVSILEFLKENGSDHLTDVITEFEEIYDKLLL